MRQFMLTRSLFDADITAQITLLDDGIQALICGGTRPHLGAVSIVEPDGAISTTQFPGHREGIISEQWATAFLAAGYSPSIVAAGIHYDHLSKGEIAAVLGLTDEMLREILEKAHETHGAAF